MLVGWLTRIGVVVVVGVVPGLVHAQDGVGPQLEQAREHVLYARYEEAVSAGIALLERNDLSASQRNAALEVVAIAYVANGDRRRARRTLTLLYQRDPRHRLSDADASPRMLSAFARAREAASDPITVTLDHEAPVLARHEAPEIEVRITEGADAVEEARLHYRRAGDGAFTTVVMSVDETANARARIALSEGRGGYDLEYRVEALAPSRFALAALGSEEEPLIIRVPEAPAVAAGGIGASGSLGGDDGGADGEEASGGGVLSQWWFWTAVGVVVAGGVSAYVLLGPPSDDGLPQTTLGSLPVE